MAKPTNTPRWADVGGAIVEPTSGKKNVGNVAGERPPAQYLNWLFNLIYLWIVWLNDIVAPGSGSESISISSAGVLGANGKHGDRKHLVNPRDWAVEDGTGDVTYIRVNLGTADDTYLATAPLNLRVGDRVRSIVFYAGGSNDWDFELRRVARATGAVTVVATANSSALPGEISLAAIDHTILEDFVYSLAVAHDADAVAANLQLTYAEVTYDRP